MLYFTLKMLINEQKMWKSINEVQKDEPNIRKSGGKSYILNHHEPLNMLEILEVHEPRTIKQVQSYPLPEPCTKKQYETILETILLNHI